MLSATTADNKLSIAASMATVKAEGNSGKTRSARNSGNATFGKPIGIPPNLLPMDSMEAPDKAHATVVTSSATIDPGSRWLIRGQSRTVATVATAVSVALTLTLAAALTRLAMRGKNSLGTVFKSSPKKSLIWVDAMSTAIPLVNPIVTGRGMNRTAAPNPVRPIRTSMTPAIAVHIKRPETPNLATIPATITTKAPVGPATWHRDPPSVETISPATMAV